MSDVSEAATVRLLIADYISADAVGKLNLIGGGLSIIGTQPDALGASVGNSAPFGIVVSVAVGAELYGTEASFELVLEDSAGKPVALPSPDGKGTQTMRIAQNVMLEEPSYPLGMGIPRRTLPARTQWVLMFVAGLPLPPAALYRWRVKIDHDSRDEWTEPFYVPGAPGPVVLG